MSQWVQHRSGVGEKWEVLLEDSDAWKTAKNYMILPKSEYIPCDPPEEWEDVTDGVKAKDLDFCDFKTRCLTHEPEPKLRIVKIDGPHDGPCFIVERRKS